MKRTYRATLALAAAAALLAGCATTSGTGGTSTGTTTGSATGTATGTETGGTSSGAAITVGTTDKVTSLDPAGSYDNGSFFVMNQIYPFLVNTQPGSDETIPSPDIAESAEFTAPDEFTVVLKPDLTFANGNPLTASDVKFTFDRQIAIADPNGPASLLGNLDSVEAVDDTTVVFHLKSPDDQVFIQILSSPAGPIVDEDVFPADAVLGNDEIVAGKPFAGPFSIDSYADNELVSFTAFAGYQGMLEKPATSTVNIKYYAEASNMRLDVEQGNIDVAYRSLSATDIDSLSQNSAVTVHEGPGGEIRYIVFNFNTQPYGATTAEADAAKALAVRQAIANLINRQDIATQVYKDTYQPLYSYIPAGLPGSGDQFKTLYGDGSGGPNLDAATTLLADAGVTTPVTLHLQYNPDHYGPSSGDEYAMIKSQLEAGGLFSVDLQSTEWVQYAADRTQDLYPLYQLGWFPDYSDADNYLTPFFIKDNFLVNHYDNAEVQALIEQQLTETDATKREDLFTQIQDLVSADISTLPLLQGKQIAVSGADVQGVALDASFKFRLNTLSK